MTGLSSGRRRDLVMNSEARERGLETSRRGGKAVPGWTPRSGPRSIGLDGSRSSGSYFKIYNFVALSIRRILILIERKSFYYLEIICFVLSKSLSDRCGTSRVMVLVWKILRMNFNLFLESFGLVYWF